MLVLCPDFTLKVFKGSIARQLLGVAFIAKTLTVPFRDFLKNENVGIYNEESREFIVSALFSSSTWKLAICPIELAQRFSVTEITNPFLQSYIYIYILYGGLYL